MPWFEDIPLGVTSELGAYTFTQDAIIAFARKYDPQPFHIDPVAAVASHFGGIVASGWHTSAVWMKLMVRSRTGVAETPDADGGVPPAGGPSPGFLDMRWPAPVRAGDTIRYTTTTLEKVDLKSRPTIGLIRSRNEAYNQHGETVMHFIGQGLIQRREPLVLHTEDK